MRHVILPDDGGRQLPFYLAMEEWVALNLPAGDWFFTWRVSPTVIFGRNQNIEAEVDIDYCRRNGLVSIDAKVAVDVCMPIWTI